MKLYIALPAEIEYNDNDYSIYRSDDLAYIGLDRAVAREHLRRNTEELTGTWNPPDVEGVSTSEELRSLVSRSSRLVALSIVGANAVSDLGTQSGEPVVWLVVETSDESSLRGEPIAAFADPRPAAELARTVSGPPQELWGHRGHSMNRVVPIAVHSGLIAAIDAPAAL